jgi:hypothetical protein
MTWKSDPTGSGRVNATAGRAHLTFEDGDDRRHDMRQRYAGPEDDPWPPGEWPPDEWPPDETVQPTTAQPTKAEKVAYGR